MQSIHPTTPFGRRPASLGLIMDAMAAGETLENARAPGSNAPAAVNKWSLLRAVTAARGPLGLSDRTLTLLNALLSFHPEVALSLPPAAADDEAADGQGGAAVADPACDLVVFPSNRALSARSHGMAEKTIRRHLAALVAAGLLVRRDSPNGKRYARKAGAGFSDAYGFDLTPLVLRAGEIEALAEAERQKGLAVKRLAERVTILRRDIAKTLALAFEDGLAGPFEAHLALLQPLMTPLRRIGPDLPALERLVAALGDLRARVMQDLAEAAGTTKMTGNDGENDRHQSSSNTNGETELEPSPPEFGGGDAGEQASAAATGEGPELYPLGMVMDACPDVALYAEGGGVADWRVFRDTVRTIRPMLGISPDALREAVQVLGEPAVLVAIATILQRSEHSSEAVAGAGGAMTVNGSPAIRSAGGYLRALTAEARAGSFRLGPVLMALIGQRLKARRGAGPVPS